MEKLECPSTGQLRDFFDVSPEDIFFLPGQDIDISAEETEVQQTLTVWAKDTGHTGNLYPRFKNTFSTCVARSKQLDRDIQNHGEISAEISLSYMEQSIELWNQMMKLSEGTEDE